MRKIILEMKYFIKRMIYQMLKFKKRAKILADNRKSHHLIGTLSKLFINKRKFQQFACSAKARPQNVLLSIYRQIICFVALKT